MNQIHLKIIDFLMNGDPEWLHIEKFSCRPNKLFQNFAEKNIINTWNNGDFDVCSFSNSSKID